MRKQFAVAAVVVLGTVLIGIQADTRLAAQGVNAADLPIVKPLVFQAAGPTPASIQSMVDAFRAALGGVNNGNVAGPLANGRREINWDGGGSTATSSAPTPFDGFLNNRGARFTTLGTGFVQAPAEGIAETFAEPSFASIFQPFSPVRLFSAVDSNVTLARFFVPGGGELPATTRAFGAIFTDVDTQSRQKMVTNVSFFDEHGRVLFRQVVPASAGDAGLSFAGVVFADARIARVRIEAGEVAPGSPKQNKRDVVMMDDFIYAEPQRIIDASAIQMDDSMENLR
jgi:hypothetical protein